MLGFFFLFLVASSRGLCDCVADLSEAEEVVDIVWRICCFCAGELLLIQFGPGYICVWCEFR